MSRLKLLAQRFGYLAGYEEWAEELALYDKQLDARADLQCAANDLCNASSSLANLAGGIPDGGLSQIATVIQTTRDAIKRVRDNLTDELTNRKESNE